MKLGSKPGWLKRGLFFLLLSLLAAGCLNPSGSAATPSPVSEAATATPGAPAVTPTATPVRSSITTLRLWLPPAFDPAQANPAAQLLQARLDEFVRLNPDVRLEVRIKAEQGDGGMLDSLSAAGAAAPRTLPDLALLERSLLEAAALKGYLRPLNGLSDSLEQPDWYPFARQMASVQTSFFGLPFAARALAVVHRLPDSPGVALPPADWESLLQSTGRLGFAGADPQALALLAFYRSAGGKIQDEQGLPLLEVEPLAAALDFYQQAASGRIPAWVSQTDSESQVWQMLSEQQADWLLVWSERYLTAPAADKLGIASLPTANGQPYTLATGWAWTVISASPEQQAAAIRLAEFLTEGRFLGQWAEAAGYLPPRAAALAAWPVEAQRSLLQPLLEFAELLPAEDLLSRLGPVLRQAGLDVLRQQLPAAESATSAVERLKNP